MDTKDPEFATLLAECRGEAILEKGLREDDPEVMRILRQRKEAKDAAAANERAKAARAAAAVSVRAEPAPSWEPPPEEPPPPNWEKWRIMPQSEIWKWVAVSLGVDPNAVEDGGGWGIVRLRGVRAQEFEDRLEVACASVGEALPTSMATLPRTMSKIAREAFVRWAVEIGWEMPPELSSAVPATPSESGKTIRTLNRILLGLAVRRFSFDPTKPRSDAALTISQELELAGIRVSDDAIRARLKAAVASLTEEERHAMREAKKREGK